MLRSLVGSEMCIRDRSWIRLSWMIGYCWRTSAAASRPSLTSCSGVYLFFGILMTVCATRPLTARHTNIKRAATRADEVLVAMFPLLHGLAAIRVSGDRSAHV